MFNPTKGGQVSPETPKHKIITFIIILIFLFSCSKKEEMISVLEEKTLASAGLGHNELKYITMEGRVMFDLLKVVQNGYNRFSGPNDEHPGHFQFSSDDVVTG